MLDDMYVTMSISTGLYPNLDLWTENKLQLQLQWCKEHTLVHYTAMHHALLWYQIAYADQACRTSHHASVPTLTAYSIQTSFLNLILSILCITTVINIILRNALEICKMG